MKYKLEQCIGSRVRRISRIVDGHYRAGLKEFDITENQMTLLLTLHVLGRVDQGELGKKLALKRSSISRNINILYKQGYIGKSDEYRPQVFLTDDGEELVKNLLPVWEQVMDAIVEEIGEEGMETISRLEGKVK